MATQFLLKPSIGKSAQPPPAKGAALPTAEPTVMRKSCHVPCGSLVSETPTRTDEAAELGFEVMAVIQRCWYGSKTTRGSKTPDPPVGAQKVSALMVSSGSPVVLSWMRKLELVCGKTLSRPTAPIVSGGMVKVPVPMR